MSNTQYAFLERDKVPDREALQQSIDRLGFDLKLDPEYSQFEDEGFLPFTLGGDTGPGFEIHYARTADIIEDDDERAALAGDRDCCISMVWRGSMKDLACVMIVSSALARDFDAVVSYEGEAPESASDLFESARKIVGELAPPEPSGATLQKGLESMTGCECELTFMLGRLILRTSSGARIFGAAWRASLGGAEFDTSRHSSLREEQLAILRSTGGSKSAEHRRRLGQIDAELDRAGQLDESDAERIEAELPKLEQLKVETATWDGGSLISCRLIGGTRVAVQWLAIGTSSTDIDVPGQGKWSASDGKVIAL